MKDLRIINLKPLEFNNVEPPPVPEKFSGLDSNPSARRFVTRLTDNSSGVNLNFWSLTSSASGVMGSPTPPKVIPDMSGIVRDSVLREVKVLTNISANMGLITTMMHEDIVTPELGDRVMFSSTSINSRPLNTWGF